jgi:hypothetical protein
MYRSVIAAEPVVGSFQGSFSAVASAMAGGRGRPFQSDRLGMAFEIRSSDDGMMSPSGSTIRHWRRAVFGETL